MTVVYDTSYPNMQHLGVGHTFFRSDSSFREIPAILYPRSITTDILEWHRFLKPNALLSSVDRRHNKVRTSPIFFFSISLKKSHITYIKYVFCHFFIYLFKHISCLTLPFSKYYFMNIIIVSNRLEARSGQHNIEPDLDPNCLRRISTGKKSR